MSWRISSYRDLAVHAISVEQLYWRNTIGKGDSTQAKDKIMTGRVIFRATLFSVLFLLQILPT
jgi:hypothetical protein